VLNITSIYACVKSRQPCTGAYINLLKPNSITLSGSRQVRSWSQTFSELEFGLSPSSLAAS